jgi:hypothetical protein
MVLAGVTALTVVATLGVTVGPWYGGAPVTADTPSALAIPGGAAATPTSWGDDAPAESPSGPAPSPGHSRRAVDAATGTPTPIIRADTTAPGSPATITGTADLPLAVGTRVGLAPVTNAGYRVRHRDFVGRIDLVGPGSTALDKADSTFTVRAGRANVRCVSFESVNYPGYYLRHQNFVVYLQRIDGTRLFDEDSTFCPITGMTGQHTSFQSLNYPSRYLRHRDSQLYLDPYDGQRATGAAMTFAVQAPW